MAYCKYCGMHSREGALCEWCGRELARAPRMAAPTKDVTKPADHTTGGVDSQSGPTYETIRLGSPYEDGMPLPVPPAEQPQKSEMVLDFLIYSAALVLVGSGLMAWHLSNPYVWAAIICTFAAGVLLALFRTIPAFEDGWNEVDLPVVLMLAPFLPLFLVYLAYIAYGVSKRRIARTVFWLLGPLCGVLLLLIGASAIAGPEAAPVSVYSQFRGIELLCLTAILLGWSAMSWRRLLTE